MMSSEVKSVLSLKEKDNHQAIALEPMILNVLSEKVLKHTRYKERVTEVIAIECELNKNISLFNKNLTTKDTIKKGTKIYFKYEVGERREEGLKPLYSFQFGKFSFSLFEEEFTVLKKVKFKKKSLVKY
jgi:hypothetical protein